MVGYAALNNNILTYLLSLCSKWPPFDLTHTRRRVPGCRINNVLQFVPSCQDTRMYVRRRPWPWSALCWPTPARCIIVRAITSDCICVLATEGHRVCREHVFVKKFRAAPDEKSYTFDRRTSSCRACPRYVRLMEWNTKMRLQWLCNDESVIGWKYRYWLSR